MKYINKYSVHEWHDGDTITNDLLNNIELSLQDLDDAVGSTEFDGDSISDAINNSQKVTENLLNYNCYDVLQYADRKNGTSAGITWTWNEDGSVTATGEATGTAVRNLGGASIEIPSWIVPGNTYYLKYSGTNIYFLIQYYLDGTEISGTAVRAYSDKIITVPADVTGVRIRLSVVRGVVINETVNPILLSSIPNDELGVKIEAITSTQAESTAQIARVNNILNHEPMYNYLGGVVNSPSTAYGLTCSQLDNGTYAITGTATSSRTTLFYDIYYNKTALPDGLEAGKTYHLFADSTQFGVRIISYTSESDGGTVLIDDTMDGFVSTDFTIPVDATGITFRWQARNIVKDVSYNYTDMRLMVTPPDAFMENLIKSYNENISKNARIWCIGNSFLNGAVYTNGHLDHMAPYDDAIYGQIAYALNVSPENNTHVMYSSTGLITPPSGGANGSFLDIITQTSLTPYDYLVTHFNSGDINGHALGTIDSTANDGTIAGGVIALMDYIRTNNGLCKLILLSVPPYSSDPAKSGEYVFTGNWGMGYSINDLDTLMYQLAKKLHFIYISWQDLEISYHYMNYADYDPSQTNVRHAASNAAYRALGQYVGLQLSAAISEANTAVEAQAIKDSLKSAFDLCSRSTFTAPITYSRIINSSMWTAGSGVSENTGSNFVDPKYCRTAYINFTVPTLLYIDGDYEFIVWEYSTQSISGAVFSQKKEYNDIPVIIATVQGAAYFRIGVRRKDGADITQDDITALTSSVKTFALTDTTLTLAGVPADAKATGDRCDAIDEYAKTTPMRLLANDELAEASTLLDIAPSRYFTANGAKIKALEPSFPFDIGNSTSYFVIVYKYASNFKYVRVLAVDGKRDFTGWTAASHPTTFYWNDISPDSSALNPTVKILIFGNSSTYSTWGYLPSLLSEFCSGYNFKIGILYASGQSLGGHMAMFNNNTAYTEYSVFENGAWTNTANTITGKSALDSDEWDIVAVQQSNTAMVGGTGKADVDGLCAMIAAYIDYPVQFVMNMPMTKGANCSGLESYYPDINDPEERSDAAFADFSDYCQDALAQSYISHIIPCGTAVQNARHTTLKQYGTYGYLCDDDVGHLQNGIGVLCASYAAAYKLLEIIGEKAKLFGSPLNPTDDWLTEINLFTKTAHGSCVGITDGNKILAQRCALQAVKNPYAISAIT